MVWMMIDQMLAASGWIAWMIDQMIYQMTAPWGYYLIFYEQMENC